MHGTTCHCAHGDPVAAAASPAALSVAALPRGPGFRMAESTCCLLIYGLGMYSLLRGRKSPAGDAADGSATLVPLPALHACAVPSAPRMKVRATAASSAAAAAAAAADDASGVDRVWNFESAVWEGRVGVPGQSHTRQVRVCLRTRNCLHMANDLLLCRPGILCLIDFVQWKAAGKSQTIAQCAVEDLTNDRTSHRIIA
eukprot:257493-Chlamydomonas_euryale.AAC.13